MTVDINKLKDDPFDYLTYLNTYSSPHRSRGSATLPEGARSAPLPQRRALFRKTRQRLEHGVPVGVLIRDVTMKLRALRAGEVRHV